MVDYKPKAFTPEAFGYYDGLYNRVFNPYCIPSKQRWKYTWAYSEGQLKRNES